MKKRWVELLKGSEAYATEQDRMSSHLYEFAKEHNNADELVVSKDNKLCAAVYFSLAGKERLDLKSFMREVQERTQYAYEDEEME